MLSPSRPNDIKEMRRHRGTSSGKSRGFAGLRNSLLSTLPDNEKRVLQELQLNSS
jgi:hypothetical protein